jgi:hypothetical protein
MSSEDYNEQLLRNIATGNALVERLIGEVRDSSTILIGLERNVSVMQHDVSDLVKIVRGDGNGTSGLIGRTTNLEHIASELEEGIHSIKTNCKDHFKSVSDMKLEEFRLAQQEKIESIRGRWLLLATLCGTSSVLGVVATIVLARLFNILIFK